MSNLNTLKEFLISLGFKVDAASEQAFNVSVNRVEQNVKELGEAAIDAADSTEESASRSNKANKQAADEAGKSAKSQAKAKTDLARQEREADRLRRKVEQEREQRNKRYREEAEKRHKEQLANNKAQIEGLLSYVKTIQYAALAVGIGIIKMTNDLNELYFSSLRTNTSVDKIQELGFIGKQTNADFTGSLEGLSQFIRRAPGAYDVINKLGVSTKDANGNLRATGDILLDVGKALADMPMARAIAFANVLQIDEKTLLAMRRGDLAKYAEQYKQYAAAIGIDSDQAAKNANAFKTQMNGLTTVFDLIGKKIAGNIANDQQGGLNKLIDYIVSHSDQIVTGITNFANAMASLAIALAKVAGFAADVISVLSPMFEGINALTGATGEWQGALNILLLYVGGKWLIGMLASIGKVTTAIGLASARSLGLMGILGKGGLVGGAGLAGYGLGSMLYNNFIDGTKFGESIGKGIANVLAFFGNDEAKQATQGSTYIPSTIARPTGNNNARGIRNNNPGNIQYGEFARRMGATSSDGRFAIFPNAESGLAAMSALLTNYGKQGLDSVSEIINKWAPPNENNTAGYAASVANALGVSPNQPLNINDPAIRAALMQQITRIENGSNPYATEMMVNAARTTNNSQRSNNFTVQNNITVSSVVPAGIPQDVANAAADKTIGVMRNFMSKHK